MLVRGRFASGLPPALGWEGDPPEPTPFLGRKRGGLREGLPPGRGRGQQPRARQRYAALAAALVLTYTPAQAAVRACGDPVSSGPQVAKTEAEGRQLALANWAARAANSLPPGYGLPTWRLATNKTLGCTKTAQGQFTCEAKGRACVVRQVPPDGATPAPPGLAPFKPPAKGKPAIDA